MPDEPANRRQALARSAVGTAINSLGYWLPLYAHRVVADAVLATVAEQAEAGQAALSRILADANQFELDGRSEAAAGLRIAARHLIAALEPPKGALDA
ncbi:hypothetical protein ACFXA3_00395 [Streptomyces sp. NPDC059456]|uniref:hypothetical protein n=1 Tax=Streptomyces sp. NPDC059456 TaxID=3346838 RepID=UPI0036B5547F